MGFPGQAGELGRSGFSEKLLLSKQTKDWWMDITSVKFSPPQHGHRYMLTRGHIYVNTHTHSRPSAHAQKCARTHVNMRTHTQSMHLQYTS